MVNIDNQDELLKQVNVTNNLLGFTRSSWADKTSASIIGADMPQHKWNEQLASIASAIEMYQPIWTGQLSGINKALENLASYMQNSYFSEPTWCNNISQILSSFGTKIIHWTENINNAMPGIISVLTVYADYSAQIAKTIEYATPIWQKQIDNILQTLDLNSKEISGFIDSINNYHEVDLPKFDGTYTNTLDDVIIAEFQQDIDSIDIQQENWQQRFYTVIDKWSKSNPILSWVLEKIFLTIIISIVAGLILTSTVNYITKKDIAVKENPSCTSPTIVVIPENTTLYITSQIPYWNEVSYFEESSEKPIMGWVSKRSISKCRSLE